MLLPLTEVPFSPNELILMKSSSPARFCCASSFFALLAAVGNWLCATMVRASQSASAAVVLVACGLMTSEACAQGNVMGVQGQIIAPGGTAQLRIYISAPIDPRYYNNVQWYQGALGDVTNPIGGTTTPPLNVSTVFWARLSIPSGPSISAFFPVTVLTSPAVSAPIVPVGGTSTFTIKGPGGEIEGYHSYVWYRGAKGDTSNRMEGPPGRAPVFTTPPLDVTTSYWVRAYNYLSDSIPYFVDSPAFTVTVVDPPVISEQPAPAVIALGATATLNVIATGVNLSYQWYEGPSGTTLTPITGATSASFTTPALGANTSYWVRISNFAGGVDSAAATLVVDAILTVVPTTGGTVDSGSAYTPGVSATLTAVPNPGFVFSGWTGDASGTVNPLSVLMDSNKTIGATFAQDPSDADADGLSTYLELAVYGTSPNLPDSDADGLTDAWEVGLGRFSIIQGSFTWEQARTDAKAKGGELASFPDENRWNRATESLGANALDSYNGLWIGAGDAAEEGKWTWVNGEAFVFQRWAATRPSTDTGNTLDYAEVAGGAGGEIGKWYDRTSSTTRDGYIFENGYASSPTDADSDDDGLSDGQERTRSTNPLRGDTDGDGLGDAFEVRFQLNPLNQDGDGDGIPDGAEDEDGDTLTNSEEATLGSSPRSNDSDIDGLLDQEEVKVHQTDPNKYDTDDDHLGDGTEVKATSTNPLLKDTDGDGVQDADEDLDGDGFTNRQELELFLTAPNNWSDRFAVEFAYTSSTHSLTFPTVSGRRYRVERSLKLAGWSEAVTFIGSGATVTVPLGAPFSSTWFYRVRVFLN